MCSLVLPMRKSVGSIRSVVDGDSETFVTGSHDQLLHVWKWDTKNNSIQCLYKCAGHAFSVEAVTASPDKLQVRLTLSLIYDNVNNYTMSLVRPRYHFKHLIFLTHNAFQSW